MRRAGVKLARVHIRWAYETVWEPATGRLALTELTFGDEAGVERWRVLWWLGDWHAGGGSDGPAMRSVRR